MQLKLLMTRVARANGVGIRETSSHLHLYVRRSARGLIKNFTQIARPDCAQGGHLRNSAEEFTEAITESELFTKKSDAIQNVCNLQFNPEPV